MPKKPVKTKEDAVRQQHILDLQRRTKALAGDELSFFESEDMPMELPAPEELDDSRLNAKLWEVIRGLAMLRTFLYSTDHLSDRELYEELWHEVLREETPDMPINDNSACHIDLVSSGSEHDNELYLRYYADEEERRRWAKDWPEDVMPEHEALPYDRDRHLPSRNKDTA